MELLPTLSRPLVAASLPTLAAVALLAGGCPDKQEAAHMRPAASRNRNTDTTPAGKTAATGGLKKATFAAGCFWGVEAAFRRVEGVVSTTVGYTGGSLENPTYRQVCTGRTGHAEAVEVLYDPAIVSYRRLLEVFWGCHDPTTLNRQGPDVGTQYRSAIFFHNAEQESAAKASKAQQERSDRSSRPIVTQIVPASTFYRAEEYHQQYLQKHGRTTCASTIR